MKKYKDTDTKPCGHEGFETMPDGSCAVKDCLIDELLGALKKIVAIKGSTGGYKSMVEEFKNIARLAIAKAEDR